MLSKRYGLLSLGLIILTLYGFIEYPKANLKILSYNIMNGLKSDTVKRKTFINWATKINADIIALQEVNQYSAQDLSLLATEMKYPYCVMLKENGYPTALISKYPIKKTEKVTEGMLHGFLYAQIKNYHIYVLHLNPFSYKQRMLEIKKVIDHTKLLKPKSPILIMGDFNSLSPEDSLVYHQRPRKLAFLKEHERTRPHINNLNNGQLDYTVIQEMLAAGFKDSWKLSHPETYQKSAPTAAIKSDPDHAGRIDYIWVSKNLEKKVNRTDILFDETTHLFSDHYPLLLQLKK